MQGPTINAMIKHKCRCPCMKSCEQNKIKRSKEILAKALVITNSSSLKSLENDDSLNEDFFSLGQSQNEIMQTLKH